MKKGLFIVVDGPSASGKDSIIKQVIKDLKKLDLKPISIEETKEKKYDREKILLAKQSGDKEVAKTIINERKKLYLKKVIPQLSKGVIVIANRGEPSTLSYQTLNELTMKDAWNMHRKQNIPLPNLVVITNCSVLEAIRREGLRKTSSEEKNKSFLSGKFTSLEKRKLIHANYKKVKDFLNKKGVSVIYLDTDKLNVLAESKRIVSFIKNKKIILIDMDGVLADFEKGFLKAWQRKFPKNPHIPLGKRKGFSVHNDYPQRLAKDVESIYRTPGFFQNLPVIAGGKEALTKMQALGHEVFICTSPISKYENCILEKYHWTSKNLGYEWTKKMIVTKDKTLIYGDILIDDKPEHLGVRDPVWKYVIFDAPYNKRVKSELRITWKNWEKILALR